MSTHVCNLTFPGLPTVLMGHIMPDMTSASLFGIRVLCKARCTVIFDDNKCQVIYDRKIILTGYKDPTSNLWMLPLLPINKAQTTHDAVHHSLLGPCVSKIPRQTINFSYHRTTKRKQCQVYAPKSLQSTQVIVACHHLPRLPPWCSPSLQDGHSRIPPSKPGNVIGAHETASKRHPQQNSEDSAHQHPDPSPKPHHARPHTAHQH